MSKMNKNKYWCYFVLLIILIIYLAPIYVLFGISFKPQNDLSSFWHFPSIVTFDNFKYAIVKGHIFKSLLNSLIITGFSIFLIVFIGAISSYPLARRKSKLTNFN